MSDLTFGQRLVHFRTRLKLLQKDLADQAGVSPTALNYYEKDKREPNVLTIISLAKALGVSGDELLGIDTLNAPLILTNHEIVLVKAYRSSSEMRPAVDRILGISMAEQETYTEPHDNRREAFLAMADEEYLREKKQESKVSFAKESDAG